MIPVAPGGEFVEFDKTYCRVLAAKDRRKPLAHSGSPLSGRRVPPGFTPRPSLSGALFAVAGSRPP